MGNFMGQWQRWRSEAPIYAIGLILLGVCIYVLAVRGIYPTIEGILANGRLFAVCVVFGICVDSVYQIFVVRPSSPIAHFRHRYLSADSAVRVAAGLPLLAVCIVLLPFFSKMKAAIRLFNDFTWDQTFIEWDRAIFFGHDAWEILQPVMGYPYVTAGISVLYQAWVLLLYFGVLFLIYARFDGSLRRQFFLTYILSWTVIGAGMATLLASVGPCFVNPLVGLHDFDDQMAYLHHVDSIVPVMVLPVQEMLLKWHSANVNGLGSGITAMPSMHVAIAYLFWLTMRKISKPAGVLFGAFFVVIWLGSVHLAYHYAVDGLVSVISVSVLWYTSGRVIRAWDGWLARGDQTALRTNTVPAE